MSSLILFILHNLLNLNLSFANVRKEKETAMVKKYKAIFFDWDGTAVTSRTAPVEDAAAAMKPLLQQGTKLVIVSEQLTIK